MSYYARSSVSRNVWAAMPNHDILYVESNNGLRLRVNVHTEDTSGRVIIPPQNIRCVLPNNTILPCVGYMYPGDLYRIDAVDQSTHAAFWVEVRRFDV